MSFQDTLSQDMPSKDTSSGDAHASNTIQMDRTVEQIPEEDYILFASGENKVEDSVLGTIATEDLFDGTMSTMDTEMSEH